MQVILMLNHPEYNRYQGICISFHLPLFTSWYYTEQSTRINGRLVLAPRHLHREKSYELSVNHFTE